MIVVGAMLCGLCNGWFGPDSYEDKRVEAVGVDWVVAREISTGLPVFALVSPVVLEQFVIPPVKGGHDFQAIVPQGYGTT